jgi:5-(carboxyamino)imidazole ribonucleotide mutase
MKKSPVVSIIMGSDSDYPLMQEASKFLDELEIPHEITIVSAHRTPERMFDFARNAHHRGIRVIVAGAGGAAHLPGMVAALSPLPVIGVPVKSSNSIDGWDSILSILQMPTGVPVATVALNGAKNAGILAAQILGSSDVTIREKVEHFKKELEENVMRKVEKLANPDSIY